MLPNNFKVNSIAELSNIHVSIHGGICVDRKIVDKPILLKRKSLSDTANFLAHHKIKTTYVHGTLGIVICKFVKNKINEPVIISSKMHQHGINYGKIKSHYPILNISKEKGANALIGRFSEGKKRKKINKLDVEIGRACVIDINDQQLLDNLLDCVAIDLYYLNGKLYSKESLLKKYGFEIELLDIKLNEYYTKFLLRSVTIYKLDQGFFSQLDSFAEKRKFVSRIKSYYKNEILIKLNGIESEL